MKKDDFDVIDLDETSNWSKLDIEDQLTKKKSKVSSKNLFMDEIGYIDHHDDIPRKKQHDTGKKKTIHQDAGKTKTVHHDTPKQTVVKHEAAQKKNHKKKKKTNDTFFSRMGETLSGFTAIDKLVASTGVLVLVVAIVTLSVYTSAKAAEKQIEAMAPIGEELQQIGIAGQDTLLALSTGNNAIDEFTEDSTQETYDENEDTENGEVSVSMLLTSVQKDLKIKFINKKSKKLVSNVPFTVNIKDADGKSYSKEDDDQDGIIYFKNMTPGKVTVSMEPLSEDYKVSGDTSKQTVTVKEKIDYKKIDVANEVKKESQINAKVEDTAIQNTVEATLKDTVTWVESSKTAVGSKDGYEEVNKSDVTDPSKSAHALFVKMSEPNTTEPPTEPTSEEPPHQVTPTPTPTPTQTPTEAPSPSPSPSPSPTASPATPSVTPKVTATPTVKVTPTPTKVPASANTTSLLKDKSGRQLYVKNSSGQYVEAKYADYYTNATLYRKTTTVSQYKYTGWQEIDGKTYFFDADGNKITGEQVIQGAKYNFASDGSVVSGSGTLGIDVSKWNGNINWSAVKNSGISYVIIRCGYRGSTTGALIEDPKFKSNIQGATRAGLKVGIYFFTQAVNEVEAVEEASMTVGLIRNYRISYPVFLDVEGSGGRADGLDAGTRTNVIKAYCETIRNSGYTAGVYANKTWLSQKMNAGALSSYKIWLAQYNTAPTYSGKIDLWQYTSKGSVSGVGGNTDMNLSYLGY